MAEVGSGIQITFSSGFLAEIINVEEQNIQRPSIDATHQLSTTRDYLPGKIPDYGQIQVEIAFDPKTKPPIAGAAETVTITYPDGSTWARTGFMMDFAMTAQLEERMTANTTIKFTGDLTVTPPA